MNVTKWLENNKDEIRSRVVRGITWYAATDVARFLGYSHPSRAVQRMLERNPKVFKGMTKIIKTMHSSGMIRTNLALSEEGVARLVERAQTLNAQALRAHSNEN